MEFVNTFTVPVGVDRAFEVLTDLERVAPCLPGASLDEVDGQVYSGQVKVKVGPIAVTYRGTAELTERDADAKRAVIHAEGKEARGAGTARADIAADLRELAAEETEVQVTTDLAITGKPAQFGRGVMEEVGSKLIATFADRLRDLLQEEGGGEAPTDSGALPPATAAPPADAPPVPPAPPGPSGAPAADAAAAGPGAATAAAPAADAGPRRIAPPARENEPLDLVDVAGGAVTKRLAPLAGLAVLVLLVVWWRRRSARGSARWGGTVRRTSDRRASGRSA